jgi:hypothetical protein
MKCVFLIITTSQIRDCSNDCQPNGYTVPGGLPCLSVVGVQQVGMLGTEQWDEASSTPFLRWHDNDPALELWYDNPRSLGEYMSTHVHAIVAPVLQLGSNPGRQDAEAEKRRVCLPIYLPALLDLVYKRYISERSLALGYILDCHRLEIGVREKCRRWWRLHVERGCD